MITDMEIRNIISQHNDGACFNCSTELIEKLIIVNNRTLADRVQEVVAMYPDRKIEGIKEIRRLFSLGLRDAKEAYEEGLVKYRETQLIDAVNACSTGVSTLLTRVTLDRPPF